MKARRIYRCPECGTAISDEQVRKRKERGNFDVFLAHNTKDKPAVQIIAKALRKQGIYPWLDDEQIPPGRSFQEQIQEAIPKVRTVVVFIGPAGMGRWEEIEMQASIRQFVDARKPIIPVLLPGVTEIPEKYLFLTLFSRVTFERLEDEESLTRLIWGITGQRGVV